MKRTESPSSRPAAPRRARNALVAAIVVAAGVAFDLLPLSFAQEQSADSRLEIADPALRIQGEVRRRYLRIKSAMGRLLANIESVEDEDVGARITTALRRSQDLRLIERLREVQRLLAERELEAALEKEVVLERDLDGILRILRGEDDATEAKRRRNELNSLRDQLQSLQRISDDQEEQAEETESAMSKAERDEASESLSKKQRELQRRTEKLRRDLERKLRRDERERRGAQSGAQSGENQSGEQNQGGEQDQSGEQDQGGEQDQSGEQNQGGEQDQSGEQGSQRNQQASRSLQRASQSMQGATSRLRSGNLEGALEDEEDALEQLRRAEDELAEELTEEELDLAEELLRKLSAKLHAILAEHEVIQLETIELDDRKGERASSGDTSDEDAAEEQRAARSLARRERLVRADTEDLLRFLEEAQASVIAPRLIDRAQRDLDSAATLLADGDTGEIVQLLQADVTDSLRGVLSAVERMKERLNRARERGDQQAGGPQGSPSGGMPGGMPPGGDEDKLPPASEVRMLLSEQRRLRARTRRIERISDAARAEIDPESYRRLSDAERELSELTTAFLEEYPEVDPFLLGMQPERDDATDSDAEGGETAEPDGAADSEDPLGLDDFDNPFRPEDSPEREELDVEEAEGDRDDDDRIDLEVESVPDDEDLEAPPDDEAPEPEEDRS